MSTLLEEAPPQEPAAPAAKAPDTLAASVVLLLVMTIAQRLIGFGRGLLFCRWLEPDQLGQWDIAFGFLNLIAVAAVFGLPGSFGRYLGYYQKQGHLRMFLRRTATAAFVLSLIVSTATIVARDWVSQKMFGTDTAGPLVVWFAVCLVIVIGHNYLTALFIALRRFRVVNSLQFLQSLGFALLSLALLLILPLGATSVTIGYGLATLLSAIGAVWVLRDLGADDIPAAEPVPHGRFWSKLMPFAIWMWVSNLLAGLFDLADRIMIVQHSGMPPAEALAQVGNYHSSRLIPLLFVGVAGLLGSMITPHLSHDWEIGNRRAVISRLNMVLKLLAAATFTFSICTLLCAPLLFQFAFHNKLAGGLAVLPWTLVYCSWFGMTGVAQNYLWCAERAALNSLPMALGLVLNIVLNLLLLPAYGLEGAVWATTVANLAALVLVFALSSWHGMRVDRGTWLLTLLPVSLGFGPWVALAALGLVVVLAVTTDRVFNAPEKQQIADASAHTLARLRRLLGMPPRVAAE